MLPTYHDFSTQSLCSILNIWLVRHVETCWPRFGQCAISDQISKCQVITLYLESSINDSIHYSVWIVINKQTPTPPKKIFLILWWVFGHLTPCNLFTRIIFEIILNLLKRCLANVESTSHFRRKSFCLFVINTRNHLNQIRRNSEI